MEGGEELEEALGEVVYNYSKAVNANILKAILYLHGKTPGYPPEPMGSTYRRTGTLGRSVTSLQGGAPGAISRVRSMGKSIQGIWGTNVEYAQWVIDEGKQAKAHVGRWFTLQGILEEEEGEVRMILDTGIQELIKDSGLK